ncbi:hypothetical protein SCALIN_C46_0026 [Candidatus Scalindua japonica]|uniref:DUF362 domain-containing protein n=1 Tax=Candidatus Scalindua japonica TaxID=1284222 RepID=A0A286U4N7_9BACT|nr:DUF362 domain-containing protein [Candidatus Scalindua japonica]GAX63021.1 hypothetical protein SCALIN_C46_0026 [Candidatus Scalindua japonica]
MTINKSRREFLEEATAIGTGLCASSLLLGNSNFFKTLYAEENTLLRSRVILAKDRKFINANGRADTNVISMAIDSALLKITGSENPMVAWSRLFNKNDIVGIKLNCLAGKRFSPHTEIVEAIINGIKSAGVRESNIVIFERFNRELEDAGFNIRRSNNGFKCFGTDDLPSGGYTSKPLIIGSIGSCFSKIASSFCTAIVNVPILKDHDLAGVSIGMKNFFGIIHNPNKYHDSNCDPYVADLNSHPFIKDKLRLIVCDALKAQYHGGPAFKPQWSWDFQGMLIGTDPVALDRVGAQIIEKKRKEVNMPSLKEAGREPKYIETAANLGIGVDDPSLIDVIAI